MGQWPTCFRGEVLEFNEKQLMAGLLYEWIELVSSESAHQVPCIFFLEKIDRLLYASKSIILPYISELELLDQRLRMCRRSCGLSHRVYVSCMWLSMDQGL